MVCTIKIDYYISVGGGKNEKYKRNAQMRQKEMTETHYHISKPTACFMLDLNDLKMYEDKIRTKEEQKAKEKQEKK